MSDVDDRPLVERLRDAAVECSGWDPSINAPYNDWSDLLDEAADRLEGIERARAAFVAREVKEPKQAWWLCECGYSTQAKRAPSQCEGCGSLTTPWTRVPL